MGKIVIVAYRAKSGSEQRLRELLGQHNAVLRKQDLVTNREPVIMQAEDGAFVEVFEWKSSESIALAHDNPAVQTMWDEFSTVCEFLPVSDLTESKQLFSEFEAVASHNV